MPYEIPQELEYREKIFFGLDFKQSAYAIGFGLLAAVVIKLVSSPFNWVLASFLVILGLAFMFLNLERKIKDWYAFLKFRQADFRTAKMKRFVGIEGIKEGVVYGRKK